FGYEQVAKRIANIRLTDLGYDRTSWNFVSVANNRSLRKIPGGLNSVCEFSETYMAPGRHSFLCKRLLAAEVRVMTGAFTN
ncbi:hypothetical protein, partial [Eubacterium ramulus]|uniref:hypothetical protein n=1 Tax=Eubacterium ramulus TaxID=39490 RepID=UPI001A9A3596